MGWIAAISPTWSFGPRGVYVAASPRPAFGDEQASDAALTTLVRRYLEGFGPASVADVAQFTLVGRVRIRRALTALSGELERLEGPGGVELYDIPGAERPDEDIPAPPRLMAMWDSILLAYADRGRVIPPEYRTTVIRPNGDVLPSLLIDGHVAGLWRPVHNTPESSTEAGIEVSAFHPLPEETWQAVAAEAATLAAFLAARDPKAYRRYDHWWAKLPPAADVRLLS